VLTAMSFITSAVPSAGASAVVLRARLLARSGYSAEASTFTLLLSVIYQAVGTALVALFGLGYLLQLGRIVTGEVVLFAVLVVLTAFLLWFGVRLVANPRRTLHLLEKLARFWNRLAARHHWRAVDLEAFAARLETFHRDLEKLVAVPRWKFFAATASRILLDLSVLGSCFAALGYLLRPDLLLLGYGLIIGISSLSFLPGLLGLADVSLPVIFSRFGVPGPVALASGLSYRLLAFWLVLLVGFASWQILESKAGRPRKAPEV
jgi:uncharacterized protein (TIRG00374 family)